jgi:hypothetical protein
VRAKSKGFCEMRTSSIVIALTDALSHTCEKDPGSAPPHPLAGESHFDSYCRKNTKNFFSTAGVYSGDAAETAGAWK